MPIHFDPNLPLDNSKSVPEKLIKSVPLELELIQMEKKIREELFKANSNKDGRYTRDGLKKALKNLGAFFPGWRAHRCLVKADANKDGQISEDEIDALVEYLLSRGFGKN